MRTRAFFFPERINAGWQRGGTLMVTRHGLRYCLLVGVVWLLSPGMIYGADEEGSAILTVLPTDAIPAILHPTFVPAQHARVAPDVAMIGVVFNGEAHAYAAVLLNAHEIVNSEASAVYEQQVDGQLLAFKPGPMWTLLEDTTTGSTWDIVTGTAVAGPLTGKRLHCVPHHNSYWVAWVDFYPQTTLFQAP